MWHALHIAAIIGFIVGAITQLVVKIDQATRKPPPRDQEQIDSDWRDEDGKPW